METIKFLTGALIFGAFLAGIVVMLLAVLWMVGKSQQGKEDNDDEHAETRSRNRKPTYSYALSYVPLTGIKEGEPPCVPVTLVSGTTKTLDAARDEALKLLLPNNEVQAFGVGRKRRYVFYPEETSKLGGSFTCTREVLSAANQVLSSTQWTASYGMVE